MRFWGSPVRRPVPAYGESFDPELPAGDERWYDWSPLSPPEWVFHVSLAGCNTLHERLALHFADWWRPPGRHERWVTVNTGLEEDAVAWWDLGDSYARPVRLPRIEIAGEWPPAQGLPDLLPSSVWQVGWWIVAGISFDEAHRWVEHGLDQPISNRRWATLLGTDIQVRFPGSKLARLHQGRWVPTADGLRLAQQLQQIGCRPQDFRPGAARDWSSAAGGSIEWGVHLLREWIELVKDGPEYRPWSVADHALRWLTFGIDLNEAREWVHLTGFNAYEVVAWRRQGFTPYGASLWRAKGCNVIVRDVRELHLQLVGETHGLGPKPKYRKPYRWTAPRTSQEKADERRERWAEGWDTLKWNGRGRPG